MPSGINPTLGCSPLTGCTAKDYYIPGKGVWAPKQSGITKAKIGAVSGAVTGAYLGKGDPLTSAAGAVVGMVVGHEIGAHFDKVDQIHATLLLRQTLSSNALVAYQFSKGLKSQLIIPLSFLQFSKNEFS